MGFDQVGWQLDKDILGVGAKVYSEDVCVFVPKVINTLFLLNKKRRGANLIGVHYLEKANKYQVNVSCYGKLKQLGRFDTEQQAFTAYRQEKEKYAKELAETYKESLDERVYIFLKDYKVDINS